MSSSHPTPNKWKQGTPRPLWRQERSEGVPPKGNRSKVHGTEWGKGKVTRATSFPRDCNGLVFYGILKLPTPLSGSPQRRCQKEPGEESHTFPNPISRAEAM